MTELTPEEEAASARVAEQVRLRKARREAKIKAGAESRLKTITGLGGGVQRGMSPFFCSERCLANRPPPPTDPAPAATPAATTTTATAADAPPSAAPAPATSPRQHADPEEVDISQHFYQPRTTPRVPSANDSSSGPSISDSQLRQMMLGLDRPGSGAGTPSPSNMAPGGGGGGAGMEDDPMLRMMLQILGGAAPGAGAGADTTNPFLAGINSPFFPATPPQQQQQQPPSVLPARPASAVWRLLHTAAALALGLYIALWTPFTGTRLQRDRAAATVASGIDLDLDLDHDRETAPRSFFWAFATAEALLLTTRWLLAGGSGGGSGGGGLMALLAGFLPPAARGKVEMALRYGEVLGTLRRDVLVCVFVLGAAAWWRGLE